MSQMAAGEFDKAVEPFDETMKRVLPAAKLNEIWSGLVKQYGPLRQATDTRTEKVQQYTLVFVTCQFEQGKLDAKVVFNSKGEIGGLFFVPSGQYQRPRYVDPAKCTGCGECANVCPVTMLDDFNAGLADWKAVYRLYPQAIPAATTAQASLRMAAPPEGPRAPASPQRLLRRPPGAVPPVHAPGLRTSRTRFTSERASDSAGASAAPARIGTRPAVWSAMISMIRRRSSAVKRVNSPVEPLGYRPWTPRAISQSTYRRSSASLISPRSSSGTTLGVKIPVKRLLLAIASSPSLETTGLILLATNRFRRGPPHLVQS